MLEQVQIRRPKFLKMYDMSRTTFDRLRHRYHDPLPTKKIGKNVYVDMVKYPDWEQREMMRSEGN